MSDIERDIPDAALIERARGGDLEAFSLLHDRHRGSATALARRMSRNAADADDIVAEGFARVLTALQAGRGPDVAFRPYLLSTIRRLAYDHTRQEQRETPVETNDDVVPAAGAGDPIVDGFEREAAAAAFSSLPERWRLVLWHTEVEGESPAEVARTLGMSANAVSALAYRAREGLRQAYLNEHAPAAADSSRDCSWVRHRLGGYVRGSLTAARTVRVEAHLEDCSRCHAAYLELALLNTSMPALVAVAVLGGVAPAYLAETGTVLTPLAGATASTAGIAPAASTGPAATTPTGGASSATRIEPRAVAATVIIGVIALAAALGVLSFGRGGSDPAAGPSTGSGRPEVEEPAMSPSADRTDDPSDDPADDPAANSDDPAPQPLPDGPVPPSIDDTGASPFGPDRPDPMRPRPSTDPPPGLDPLPLPTGPPSTGSATSTPDTIPTTTTTAPTTTTTVAPDPSAVPHRINVAGAGDLVRGRPGTVAIELTHDGTDGLLDVTFDLTGLRIRGDGPFPFGPLESRMLGRSCEARGPHRLVCTGPALRSERAEILFLPVMVDGSADVTVTQDGTVEHTPLPTETSGFAARHASLGPAAAISAGNAVIGCPPDRPPCVSNNEAPMVRIDVDGDPTTSTSSSATLDLPPDDSVLSATLWWGADLAAGSGGSAAPDPSARDRVLLRDPRGAAHIVRAERVDEIGSRYHAVADVTSIVANGGGGPWTAADIQAATGVDRYGGWFLQVVHRNDTTPVRSIVVLDGFSLIERSRSVEFRIGGFVMPAGRAVDATIDAFAYEGDADLVGDQLRVNGVDVSNPLNPVGNTFNSTVSNLGRRVTGMVPDAAMILGIDLDRFDVSTLLEPGSRSAIVEFATSGDAYLPGALVFSIDQ